MPVRFLSFLSMLALAGSLSPRAVGQSQSQGTQFRSRVDLVVLDVTVLDRNRRPIRSLSAEDFDIFEDGKRQTVTAFQAVEHQPGPAAAATWLKAPPVDVAVNRHDDGRLLVLVIDDATLPHDAYMIRRARDTARAFVESLGPGDLCAILFTRDNRYAQDFTRDRSRLLAAANRVSSGFLGAVGGRVGIGGRAPAVNTDLSYYLSSLDTLSRVSEHLESVAGRRKTIAYLSIGVPLDPDALARITLAGTASMMPTETQRAYVSALRRTIDRAQRANVAIYALDPSSLDGIESYNRRNRGNPLGGPRGPTLFRDTLLAIASNTGGRAFINNNDFRPGLKQLFEETSAYYLLVYSPSVPARPGEYRRVEVKTSVADAEVVARKGYFGARSGERSGPALSGGQDAIAGVLPDARLPLRASAAPVVLLDGSSAIVLTLALDRDTAAVGSGDQVEISTHLFDTEGRPKESFEQTANMCVKPGWCEMTSLMPVRPGRRAVRVGLRHVSSNVSGSVYLDVDVPDLSRQALTLSGLVVSADPAWAATTDDAVRRAIPVLPTTRRDFLTSDTATFFLRIGQRKDRVPAALTRTLQITNAKDETVTTLSRTIDTSAFVATGFVDDRITLPLSELSPGQYLVSVRVESKPGGLQERRLSFAIR